ncbi:MAG: Cobalt-zinc-cadmium resistance protein [uncultured Thiotrichaceae bacterium]|uniref:Cobalt-zinc-cadmium resistance protein n=1 Tax=uncultured Thiotrichaceae bacterium TaxID=298394 RepID=A0A6S6TIC8_9GAMM|nr:MAG: Cobalt-zinc-cadmium resistance protein [uncultured Thiotrichaceae bacterium]
MSHSHHHSHIAISNVDKSSSRYKQTRNVTIIGAVTNLFLAAIQLIGGFFTQSQALIADGFHTLSDLASDFVVLVAAKMASKDADDDHPYGHGRIETVATIVLGASLVLVGIGIAYDATQRLFHVDRLLQPTSLGLLFAGIAIVAKESLYHITRRVGKRINSPMLMANAWHHRSDAISSIAVLLGIAGTIFLGIPWLDAAAAIIVALMIMYMGSGMVYESVMELIDTALDPERTQEMQTYIHQLDGVENVHMLRTRMMGGRGVADVHVQVGSMISVSEGHHIAERVMHGLQHEFEELHDITVHIDPEDDECSSPCEKLPSRQKILQQLQPHLDRAGFDKRDKMNLHYLDGTIQLDFCLHSQWSQEEIAGIRKKCLEYPEIHKVEFFLSQGEGYIS